MGMRTSSLNLLRVKPSLINNGDQEGSVERRGKAGTRPKLEPGEKKGKMF